MFVHVRIYLYTPTHTIKFRMSRKLGPSEKLSSPTPEPQKPIPSQNLLNPKPLTLNLTNAIRFLVGCIEVEGPRTV